MFKLVWAASLVKFVSTSFLVHSSIDIVHTVYMWKSIPHPPPYSLQGSSLPRNLGRIDFSI